MTNNKKTDLCGPGKPRSLMSAQCIAGILLAGLTLSSCQLSPADSDRHEQLAAISSLTEYHNYVGSADARELLVESTQLQDALAADPDDVVTHARSLLVQQQLTHLQSMQEQQQIETSLRRQIESLAQQIDALTAIEQQIIQREQGSGNR
jgi:hypothetical protein